MGRRTWRGGVGALGLAVGIAAACDVAEFDLKGRQCPCTPGWYCDARLNLCVAMPPDLAEEPDANASDAAAPDVSHSESDAARHGGEDASASDAADASELTDGAGTVESGPVDAGSPPATAAYLYWSDPTSDSIVYADLGAGSTPVTALNGRTLLGALAYHALTRELYWVEEGRVYSMPLEAGVPTSSDADALGVELAIEPLSGSEISDICFDGTLLYAGVQNNPLGGGYIGSLTAEGATRSTGIYLPSLLASIEGGRQAFIRSGTRILRVSEGQSEIVNANFTLPRSSIPDMVGVPSRRELLWIDRSVEEIRRSRGFVVETLVAQIGEASVLAVDEAGGRAIWANNALGKTFAADLDAGEGREELLAYEGEVGGLALVRASAR